MARSPAHKFGQIIGDVLELAVVPLLQKFASEHQLFLDRKGPRSCRDSIKCSWVDRNGNSHDLDFVLERGGSDKQFGAPVAFIEVAWRRYTKHSRNKAQEIQGAIEPLADTHFATAPFKGAILAGDFTSGALTQLRSLGFSVLYFSYDSVVSVFREFGIDAAFDESTADSAFRSKVRAYASLKPQEKSRLPVRLLAAHDNDVSAFMNALEASVLRQIECVVVLLLYGTARELQTVDEAIAYIETHAGADNGNLNRYELEVRYSNGDAIVGRFKKREDAIAFLLQYQPARPPGNR